MAAVGPRSRPSRISAAEGGLVGGEGSVAGVGVVDDRRWVGVSMTTPAAANSRGRRSLVRAVFGRRGTPVRVPSDGCRPRPGQLLLVGLKIRK